MDIIFENQTTDGESTVFYHSAQKTGMLHLYVEGSLGGGTLIIKAISPKTGQKIPLPGAEEITSTGLKIVQTISFHGVVELTGSSGANLTVTAESESDAFRRIGALN